MPRYSAQFRNTILKRILPPESKTAAELSAEYGVSVTTILNWKFKMNNGTLSVDEGAQSNSKRQLTEKLSLLLESKTIPESEFGSWLRDNGLHSEHLTVWEQEVRDSVAKSEKELRGELKEAKKQLKQQQKELNRKEKALAEMAAIIALQKKTELLFQDREDD